MTFNLQMQEPGRLFCPHCGNATLDKVELTIGPDGTEQYGVRKRFNTRGTRFSLPKPKVTTLQLYTCQLYTCQFFARCLDLHACNRARHVDAQKR